MSVNNILDRFERLRGGSGAETASPSGAKVVKPATPPPSAPAQTKGPIRRVGAKPEPEPSPPPPQTSAVLRRRAPVVEASPPTSVGRSAPHPAEPRLVAAKQERPTPRPVEPDIEPQAADGGPIEAAPEPVDSPVLPVMPPIPPVASGVARPAHSPPTAAVSVSPAPSAPAAIPATKAAPSIDDLLGRAPTRRVHKPLSQAEIAIKEREYQEAVVRQQARMSQPPALRAAPAPAAVVPVPVPVKVEVAAPVKKEVVVNPSLEELLREQGIVQHKPKKGRRIIEDDLSAGTAAPRPAIAPTAAPTPTMWENDAIKNKPIRFLDPTTLKTDKDAKGVIVKPKGKGKRKEVVAQPDGLFPTAESRRVRSKRAAAIKPGGKTEVTVPAAHKRMIKLTGQITVADIAHEMGIKGGQVIGRLVKLGQMVTLNEKLDIETAQIVAQEFGWDVEDASFKESEYLHDESVVVEEGEFVPRSPVVTIMGHVDHGKTSLLDAIRNTRVAEGEAGGITQHITAFEVLVHGKRVVFVDTPGHAAFTAMRARGAQITDIVVLVVAATEGVMPQTVEVIAHAKAAGVPIIVAMNKIDLPEANLDKTKKELSGRGLLSEEWGGDVQMVPVSAKKRENIEGLLESIAVQAELMELKANPNRAASGRVVEAQLETGRGPVATLLVQKGTLKPGDIVVAGQEYGKVRALLDTTGKRLKDAGPATPVVIMGLSGLPAAGDEFAVVESDRDAKDLVDFRRSQAASLKDRRRPHVSLDDFYKRLQEGESKELKLIVKADALGSVEALRQVFSEIRVKDLKLTILHSAVGGVTESDVTLASASDAVIVGFNVRPDAKARKLAEEEKVDVRSYRVIYEAVDDIKQALVGMLEPERREKVQGHAEVRAIFKVTKVGTIAGSTILDGKITRGQPVRLLRNSVVVWEGKVGGLRRFKDDVKEVLQGYECGISLDGYEDVKEGDVIESYVIEEIRPTI